MTIFCVCNISWTQVHDYYQAYNYSPGLYSFSLLIYTWFIALLNELFSRDRILCSKTTDERWSNEDEIYKTALPHVLVGKNKGLKIKSKLLSKLLRIYPYFRLMASWAPPPMPCCHLVQGNTPGYLILSVSHIISVENLNVFLSACCLGKPETSCSSYLCNKAEKIKNLSLCWNLSLTTMAQNSFQDWRFLYLFFKRFFLDNKIRRDI